MWLKIIRFNTQAICLGSIVPQNVLKQHILLPDNGEIIIILTKNNSIFPPNTCINPAKSEWLRFNNAIILVYPHTGQSVSVKFLRLTS